MKRDRHDEGHSLAATATSGWGRAKDVALCILRMRGVAAIVAAATRLFVAEPDF